MTVHRGLDCRSGRARVRRFAILQPTHVIHSAAAYKDPTDWLEDARTNVEGTINVIAAAKESGAKRIINFHTALGYGRPDTVPIPVTAPMRPFTSYGISKQAGENYLALSGLAVRVVAACQCDRPAACDRSHPDILQAAEGRPEMLLLAHGARFSRHGGFSRHR